VNENTATAVVQIANSSRASWIDQLFRKLLFLIPLGVIGNVVFVLIATDGRVFDSGIRCAPEYIIIAMLVSIAPWFTGSLRMQLWSGFLGKRIRYQDAFRIALGAELGAAISPPLLGGAAVKTGMLMQKGFSGNIALTLAALESMQDGLFFLLVMPLALTLSSSWDLPAIQGLLSSLRRTSLWMYPAGGVVAFCAFLLLSQPRFRAITRFPLAARLAARIGSAWHTFILTGSTIISHGKMVFGMTFLLTAVQWLCRYSIISILLMGLGLPAQPVLFLSLQVLVFIFLSFIPTPGGVGGAEAIFYLLYRPFLAPDSIGAATMGWRFLTFYFLLLLAAALFLILGIRATTAREPSQSI